MTQNKSSYWYWLIAILLIIGLPLGLNWIILWNTPSCFVFEKGVIGGDDAPQEWLSFWATYISTIASFAMVFITWRTLQQNREQVNELKRQWAEQNKPILIFEIQEIGCWFYLIVTNVGNAPAYNIDFILGGDFLVYPSGKIKCTDIKNHIPMMYKGQTRHICLKVLGDKGNEYSKDKILSVDGKYQYNGMDININEILKSNHGFPQVLLTNN